MDIVKYLTTTPETRDLCTNHREREVHSVDGAVRVFRLGKEDRNILFNVENEHVRLRSRSMVTVLTMDADTDSSESRFPDPKDTQQTPILWTN
jgi:hypothetical protein